MSRPSVDSAASVRNKLEALRAKSFEELSVLPGVTSEEISSGDQRLTLSVWHDALNPDEHRIVVQLYKPGALGVGRMLADGFVINRRDEKRPLSTTEWAPFS